MSEPGRQLAESWAGPLRRPRRYSPFHRAPGLRRVPDEPFGLAFLSSLVLHVVIIVTLIRVTDAPPEKPGADVISILTDLTISAPAISAAHVSAAKPPLPGRKAVVARPGTRASAPARTAGHPTAGASTPTAERQPVPAPHSAIAVVKAAAAADPVSPPSKPLPVSSLPPPAPVEERSAPVPAMPAGASMVDLDTPLDAGWAEPLPTVLASPNLAQPARSLTPVPLLPDSVPRAPGPISATALPSESAPVNAENREGSVQAAVPAPSGANAQAFPAPQRIVVAETPGALSSAAPSTEASAEPAVPATPPAVPHPMVAQTPVLPEPVQTAPAAPDANAPQQPAPERTVASETPTGLSSAPPATVASSKLATRPTPPAPPPAVVPAPGSPAGSPFGLSLSRALVRLDGPRARVTDQPGVRVSGRVLGGAAERLVLYVNGAPVDVNLASRTFEASIPLRPGPNDVRAAVTGPGGLETEDAIKIQYVPTAPSSAIALTSPPDGLVLGPDDPPVVVVEGEVGDKSAATVLIVANDRRIPVTLSGGRFRHVLLLPDPVMRLWAETSGQDTVRQSETVTVRTAGARPAAGVLVMEWPAGTNGASVEVSATWRAHPEYLDGPIQTMRLAAATTTADDAPSQVFYLRGLKPGVHTLIVRYRGSAPLGDARPTLYLPGKEHLTSRALRPVSLNGGGRRVLTKILMPQAILWEQDDWFSGRSESVDTVTKFRIPEGISWVERKADLP